MNVKTKLRTHEKYSLTSRTAARQRLVGSTTKRSILALSAAALAAISSTHANAASNRTWVASPTSANWSLGANWGGTAPVAGDSLFFASSSTTSLNDDITAATSFAGITFNSGASAFTFTGNSLTLGGDITDIAGNTETINLNLALSATRNLNVTSGGTLDLGGVISGSSGLNKIGTGTAVINGSSANSYTGATAVNAGTLQIDFSNFATAINLVSSSSALSLGGGGALYVKGYSSGTTSQTLGNLTIGAIDSTITLDPGTGSGTTLVLGNTWTRSSGAGILALSLPASTTLTSNPTASLQGSMLPFVTINGTDFGAVSGGNIVAFTGYTPYVTGVAPTSAIANTLKIDSTSTGNASLASGSTSLNSILVNDTAARTLDIGSGNTLNLGVKGAIFTPSGTGALTIGVPGTAGTINAGGTTVNAAGELIFINNSANAVTVNSLITNHGTGAVTVSKSGMGTVNVANGSDSYTGGNNINGGTLQLGAANALGSTNNTLADGTGGTLDLNGWSLGIGSLNGAGTIDSTAVGTPTLTIGNNNGTGTFSGAIQNTAGTLNVTKVGTGAMTLSGLVSNSGGITVNAGGLTLSGSNTYTGTTTVNGGTLAVNLASPNGGPGPLGNSTTDVLVGDPAGLANAALNNNVAGTLARNITIQSSSGGSATVTLNADNSGTGTGTMSGTISLGSPNGSGRGVTLTASNFSTAAYSGIIKDPTGLVGAGGQVTVSSSATVYITNNSNSYTGGTILNSGTLIIGNSNVLGAGPITINGGTFGSENNEVLPGNTQTWAGNFGWTSLSFGDFGTPINLGSGAVLLTGNRIVSGNNKGMVVSGVISDGGIGYSLAYKSSSGTSNNFSNSLTLNGANTFSGGMTIDSSNGQVQFVIGNLGTSSTGSAIGIGPFTIASGTKAVVITNNAPAGTLATNNPMTWNSDFTINGNSLNFGTGAVSLGTSGTTRTITTGNSPGVYTVAGVISDGTVTSITKAGTGTLALTGTNTFSGGSVIAAGTLAGNTASLPGNITFNAASGSATLLLDQTLGASPIASGTFAGVISQTGGITGALTKNNAGTVILTASNSYTGATTVNGGTLQVDASQGGSVSSSSALTLGGGTFYMLGNSSGATTQTMGNFTLNNSGFNSTLIVDGNTGSGTTLALGTITTATSGTAMNIATPNGGAVTTTTALPAVGIYSPRIVFNGADWATTTSGSTPFALSAYAGYIALPGTVGTNTNNSIVTDNFTVGTGTTTTNSLKITDTQANQSLNVVGSSTLTMTSGGILFTGGFNYTINGTTINSSLGTPTGNDFIFQTYGAGTLTVVPVIGGTSTSITKSGPGILVLSPLFNNVFYGGTTYVDQGTLRVGHAGALGAGEGIFVNGGAILDMFGNGGTATGLNGTGTIDTTAVGGAATLTVGSGTFTGIIQNTQGTLSISKTNTGTEVLTGANTFKGTTTVASGGIINLSNSLALQNSTLTTNGIVFDSSVQSHAFTLGGLSGSGNITLADNFASSNPVALSVGNNNGSTSYSGVLSGAGSLTKVGTGSLTVSGGSSYTGTTTVSAGSLIAGANVASGANSPFGNASSAVVLGDANTATNSSSPSLLTGGAFTVARPVAVANQITTGTYTIGGNTDNNSGFSGLITVNQPLTVSQVTNTGINALSLTGGITSGNAGNKVVTFAGPGNTNVTTTGISDGGTGTVGVALSAGVTTFGVASTYSGNTNVNGGTLLATNIGGSATGSGTVTVNTGGSLGGTGIISGSVTISSGGTLFTGLSSSHGTAATLSVGSLTLGGSTLLNLTALPASTPGVGSADEVVSSGLLSFGGTLTVSDPNALAYTVGDTFDLFGFGSETGSFSSAPTLPALSTGLTWDTSMLTSNGILSIISTGPANGSSSWINLGSDNNWETAGNWAGSVIPGVAGNVATFSDSSVTVPVTANLSANETVGGLTFNGNGGLTTISASSGNSLTLDNSNAGVAVSVTGNAVISAPVILNDNATVTTAAANSLVVSGGISGSKKLTTAGSGSVTLSGTNSYGGGTEVSGGTLNLQSTTALPTASALTIDGGASLVVDRMTGGRITLDLASLANSGTINLKDNRLVIHNGDQTTADATTAAIFTQLHNGFAGGSWTGGTSPSILSSAGAGSSLYTLGEVETGTDVKVNYAYYGDADLSGTVDGTDYSLIDSGFGGGATGWQNGDFNYDGVVDGSDYSLIDNAFNTQTGTAPAAQMATNTSEIAGGSAAVPEPASLGLLGIGALGLMSRRRRRV